jgi:hypothetical protein
MKKVIPFWIAVGLIILLSSCNGMSSGIGPDLNPPSLETAQSSLQTPRELIGIWELRFDYSGTTAIEVTDRVLAAHFNVKAFLKPPKCSDCLKFSNVNNDTVNKVISADLTIKNPTALSGADVRGIVMSNNPAVYLANPDDYTTLFDPDTPPDINPFRLFGKTLPNGVIGPGVEATEHFEVQYDTIPFAIMTAFDACFKIQDKREPYAINNQTISGNLDTSGVVSRTIEVQVLDRHNDVGTVSVSSTELGLDIKLNPNPDKPNYYLGYITNENQSPAGDYKLLISATDAVTPWILYDYLPVTISESVGEWQIEVLPFANTGCPRDLGAGVDMGSGNSTVFIPGGNSCKYISKTTTDFGTPSPLFNLDGIDSQVPGFSPYPCTRLDASFTGGLVFFSDSDDIYTDPFYTGPVSSLMLSIYPGSNGVLKYLDPGDGDASRMYPSNTALHVVDVTDDLAGAVYGLWADPDGVVAPELYGLTPDYTRHDVFMGGSFPDDMLGDGPGKIPKLASRIKAFDVSNVGVQAGFIYVLESNGSSSEIEVIHFASDFQTKITTYTPSSSISLGSVEAVDLDIAMFNPTYTPNPSSDNLAVLIRGGSGGWVRMYSAGDKSMVDEMGDASNPSIPGTAVSLDVDNSLWKIDVLNQNDSVVVFSWVI